MDREGKRILTFTLVGLTGPVLDLSRGYMLVRLLSIVAIAYTWPVGVGVGRRALGRC